MNGRLIKYEIHRRMGRTYMADRRHHHRLLSRLVWLLMESRAGAGIYARTKSVPMISGDAAGDAP